MLAFGLLAARADAQLLFVPELVAEAPDLDGIPSELDLAEELPSPTGDRRAFSADEMTAEDISLLDDHSLLEGDSYDDEFAPLLSSGTWFRRGFWYTRQEVVLLQMDNYKNKTIAVDFSNIGVSQIAQIFAISRTVGGLAANAKLTLGRFLYRDANNRDHTAEFTFMGPGKWGADGVVRSISDDALFSALIPFVPGFTQIDVMSFDYESRLSNLEWNYRMRRRLQRDVLMLDANGRWNREMQPEMLYGYLFGLRWMSIDELFNIETEATGRDAGGIARVRSQNDLIGFQFGGEAIYQHKRWSLEFDGKAGPYVNFAGRNISVHSRDVAATPDTFDVDNNRADRDVIGFIGEIGLHATYFARPNLSFRVGYEALWVNSLTLALRELRGVRLGGQSAPVQAINTAGGLQYMGFSTGMELHW